MLPSHGQEALKHKRKWILDDDSSQFVQVIKMHFIKTSFNKVITTMAIRPLEDPLHIRCSICGRRFVTPRFGCTLRPEKGSFISPPMRSYYLLNDTMYQSRANMNHVPYGLSFSVCELFSWLQNRLLVSAQKFNVVDMCVSQIQQHRCYPKPAEYYYENPAPQTPYTPPKAFGRNAWVIR